MVQDEGVEGLPAAHGLIEISHNITINITEIQ